MAEPFDAVEWVLSQDVPDYDLKRKAFEHFGAKVRPVENDLGLPVVEMRDSRGWPLYDD